MNPYYIRPNNWFPENVHTGLANNAILYTTINGYDISIERYSREEILVEVRSEISFWKKFLYLPEWLIWNAVNKLKNRKLKPRLDPVEYIIITRSGFDHVLAFIFDVVWTFWVVCLIKLLILL